MPLSSSAARNFTRHCPHALTLYELHTPYARDGYAQGIAAHAMMQTALPILANATDPVDLHDIAGAVALRLASDGRSYAGTPEPPLPFEDALAGVTLARVYLETHDVPAGRVEVGFAIDADGNAVDYRDPSAVYHGILDLLYLEETEDEEGYSTTTLVVRDWKTAWSAGAADLESVQIRNYVLLAFADYRKAHGGDYPASVRREITNLRSGATYRADLILDEGGLATLEEWRRAMLLLVKACARQPRIANPGPRCLGCPYVLACEYAQPCSGDMADVKDPADVVRQYAIAQACADALKALARTACDHGDIQVPGGSVGYHATTTRAPAEGAVEGLVKHWCRLSDGALPGYLAEHATLHGLLTALDLGAANIEHAVKVSLPTRKKADRETNKPKRVEILSDLLTDKTRIEFGVTTDGTEINVDGDPAAQTTPTDD